MNDSLFKQLGQEIESMAAPLLLAAVEGEGLNAVVNGDHQLVREVLAGLARAMSRAADEQHKWESQEDKRQYRYEVHTAMGQVTFRRLVWQDEYGAWTKGGLEGVELGHGCTWSVRKEACALLSQGTAQEARETMLMYRNEVPSTSTLKRVALDDGQQLAKVWDTQLEDLLDARYGEAMEQAQLGVVLADGAMVPLRGAKGELIEQAHVLGSEGRAYREARVVTCALLGAADAQSPKKFTVYDETGTKQHEQLSNRRERLAHLVFAQMPSSAGPSSTRADDVLKALVRVVRRRRPQLPWQALTDGGGWPQKVVDEAVGSENRTTDFYHACEHLHSASESAFSSQSKARHWYQYWHDQLLKTDDGAQRLVDEMDDILDQPPPEPIPDEDQLRTEAGYFRKRIAVMKYAVNLRHNKLIGSGYVEADVKTAISLRMKRAGASWSEPGGDAILAIRCLKLSDLWHDAWNMHRENQQHSLAAA